MLRDFWITMVIAGGTAALQIFMKGSSRTNRSGKSHGLSIDDGLFWSDWTIAAALALSTSVITAAREGKQLAPYVGEITWGYVAIVLGGIALPFFLRTFAYDPGAQIKRIRPKGIGWVIIANVAGVGILFIAVGAGVKVYEW